MTAKMRELRQLWMEEFFLGLIRGWDGACSVFDLSGVAVLYCCTNGGIQFFWDREFGYGDFRLGGL
jgi:hypothetical protein